MIEVLEINSFEETSVCWSIITETAAYSVEKGVEDKW